MSNLNPNDFTEISITVPWGHIAGRWYGDQMQRPILALHGWLDNCGTFAKLAPLLAPHTSLLCLDLPGHGHSSHMPAGILYNNMEYVRVILRVMQSYNWQRVSLLGHSMGGAVAFYFTAIYPERVDMLIGLDIIKNATFGTQLMPNVINHLVEKNLTDNERLLQQSPMTEPPSYTFAELEQLLHAGSEYSVALENCKYILERNISRSQKYPDKFYFSRDGRVKFIGDITANKALMHELAMRVCRVPIPHLVLKGGASTNISGRSNDLVDTMQQHNPHFEMHLLPGETHHLHLNNAPPVAELIVKFLRKHRPAEVKLGKGQRGKL